MHSFVSLQLGEAGLALSRSGAGSECGDKPMVLGVIPDAPVFLLCLCALLSSVVVSNSATNLSDLASRHAGVQIRDSVRDEEGNVSCRIVGPEHTWSFPPALGKGIHSLTIMRAGGLTNLARIRELSLRSLEIQGSRSIDYSALRCLPLTNLVLVCCAIADLEPLRGKQMTALRLCGCREVDDISPLRGMPLKSLVLNGSEVSDLSPLQGMRLRVLSLANTDVSDVSPLQGMPLVRLNLARTAVSNLSALSGMLLERLVLNDIPASDLSALKGAPLRHLSLVGTRVSDYSTLLGMPLESINVTPQDLTNALPTLNRIKTLRTINHDPVGGSNPRGRPGAALELEVEQAE